jgi:hypothetical protein
VLSREGQEFADAGGDCTAIGCASDGDAASAAELKESFVSERPQGAQHRVGVHPDNRGQVFGGWKPLAGFGLAIGNRASDLGGDLFVKVGSVASADLDPEHDASYISFIVGCDQAD